MSESIGKKPSMYIDVQLVDPSSTRRILTKFNTFIGYLIMLPVLAVQLVGIGLMVSVFPTVFPDPQGSHPFWNLPPPEATKVLAGGLVLTLAVSIYGLMYPGLLSRLYIYSVAKSVIRSRRDAIVEPDGESLFVDVIPRSNWNRMMLENASDVGFLIVDTQRREIRFEGDRERYRIPANALYSCELEKSFHTSTAQIKAPGRWLAVVRAAGRNGPWEAPFFPRLIDGPLRAKRRLQAIEELQKKIQSLIPAQRADEREE